MATPEAISEEQERLATYRSTLAFCLRQEALRGRGALPVVMAQTIVEARRAISRSKTLLRAWGVEVEDQPDDEPPGAPEA